ncbi:serine/threonine protein phosphatase [Clostridium carboxidivorans P7]|uniref:SpoIIE family protein phosphatase n=1 Tax=Clostridium carboxidivorans TaxID=217159 RepID=UPI0001D3937A|nr:SpoIIE family protein phosphatase [Clostridium carboxidivorans]AKN31237.1 serine/threonine protein phosphatase [Clostridium carboxidivorans P7]EFG88354.1 stage II sporulation protein E (SpoIIE) [Clostridium carboxidivorans P7]
MDFFIEVAHGTLIKHGEELPGDMVNVVRLEDCTIIVLADGLGSGVKANILATLTSKIAGTMLKEGANIYETVDTIANTLPVCKVRNIAYSTFTIIKIYNNGQAYIAEYDNPPFFAMRNGESMEISKKKSIINGKVIKESNLILQEDDVLTVVSDGVIHAGLGEILNLGWQWKDVETYLKKRTGSNLNVQVVAKDLLEACWDLYCRKPGDDTTVVSIKVRKPSFVNVFTGPPKDKEMDSVVIKNFMDSPGKKVICGGTAANIAERELGGKLKVNLDFFNKDVPPTATMEGIDLITEGVLTLSMAIEKIKKYLDPSSEDRGYIDCDGKDGVSSLVKILMEDCTHLNLWIGMAVNPAHQNPDFPADLSIKLKLVGELYNQMKALGKKVHINYV